MWKCSESPTNDKPICKPGLIWQSRKSDIYSASVWQFKMTGLAGHHQVLYECWVKDKTWDLKSFYIYMWNTLILWNMPLQFLWLLKCRFPASISCKSIFSSNLTSLKTYKESALSQTTTQDPWSAFLMIIELPSAKDLIAPPFLTGKVRVLCRVLGNFKKVHSKKSKLWWPAGSFHLDFGENAGTSLKLWDDLFLKCH